MKNLLKVKPLIEKHQLKNGKGRGKLTILFTPEQMAAIEANMLNTVPGTNVNSNRTVGETARRAGVESTRTRLRSNYKRDKRRNVGEMHTYVASKERQDPITGEPIITETVDVGSNGSGEMSGRDPLLGTIFDLYTGTKAWNSGAKLLLWGTGKYMPSTMLGLWGRKAIINDVARRSFNPGGWSQVAAKPAQYDIRDNIILYRADATTPKGRKGVEGDDSGEFIGKWFTDDSSKPNWYASDYMKHGESPMYYQVTVPKYWAEKQSAKFKVPERIEYEPEDYILEDGVNGLIGLPYQGIPGRLSFLQQTFNAPKVEMPSTSLRFFERRPSRISERERLGIPKGENYYTPELNKAFLKQINDFAKKYGYAGLEDKEYSSELLNSYARALIDRHNKFYRGVAFPEGEDLDLVKNTLGNEATDELILLYVATHSRGEGMSPELYISPTTNAFSYGANGRTAIISRPYKLGKDRTKWFDEGDFNIVETGTVNPKSYNDFLGIVYPWDSPRFQTYNPFLGKKTIPEYYSYLTPQDIIEGEGYYEYIPNPHVQNELISINNPMIFRLWVENPTLETLSKKTPNVPWQLSKITVRKQGGKMFKFKKGNKIHIKKANRGKFTDYCGGEVTNECILRGKHSSNPAVRKRATFALNARRWKHKNGGQIQRLQLGKPIKWLAHLINSYGNSESKASSIPGTSLAWAISDEMKRNPKLTRQLAIENIERRSEKVRRKVGIPKKKSTPSQAAAGLAVIGGAFSPWLAVPDIVFDVAASIDEPSASNTLHTVADFPEAIAKVTPTKVDDYVARGVLMLGNVDDALSAGGKNLFGVFDGNHGQVNNNIDKTSVRESTRVDSPKRVESIKRKKLGGIVKADDGAKFTINDGLALGSLLIGNIANSIQQNKFIDSLIKANKALNKYLQSQIWNNSLSKAKDYYTKLFEKDQKKLNSGEPLIINSSPTVAEHSIWDMASKEANNLINNLNNQLQLDNLQLQLQKKSILGSSLGIAGNFIMNKFNNEWRN